MEKTQKDNETDGKRDLIELFSEILDKHCPDRSSVYELIKSFQEFAEFFSRQRFLHNPGSVSSFRKMEDIIRRSCSTDEIVTYLNMTATSTEALIIAGQDAESISLFSKMKDAIEREITE
jgi:hypothetical protein